MTYCVRAAKSRSCVTKTRVVPDSPVEVKEQIDDGLAGIRVEIARGFVGKEDARPG